MAGNSILIVELDPPMTHTEVDGLEMGILADGTPYLTARSLARMCGQAPYSMVKLVESWPHARPTVRDRALAELIATHGHTTSRLCTRVDVNGTSVCVVPDAVCMALLEYYAFEADSPGRFVARRSYRQLARQSLRRFIYGCLGHDPLATPAEAWKHLYDRLVLNPVPSGYFSLLREIAELLILAAQSGLPMGPHTLPDVSVGLAWSKHWSEEGLDEIHGPRARHPHRFPKNFPQMQEVSVWIYPLAALGEFRAWMRDHYLPCQFPRYVESKVRRGALLEQRATYLLESVNAHPVQ